MTSNQVRDWYRSTNSRQEREGEESLKLICEAEIENVAEEEWRKYLIALAFERVQQNFSSQMMNIFNDLAHGMSLQEAAENYKIAQKR